MELAHRAYWVVFVFIFCFVFSPSYLFAHVWQQREEQGVNEKQNNKKETFLQKRSTSHTSPSYINLIILSLDEAVWTPAISCLWLDEATWTSASFSVIGQGHVVVFYVAMQQRISTSSDPPVVMLSGSASFAESANRRCRLIFLTPPSYLPGRGWLVKWMFGTAMTNQHAWSSPSLSSHRKWRGLSLL